jgi:pimeloyl-ACP methyl ester carboxylesterase
VAPDLYVRDRLLIKGGLDPIPSPGEVAGFRRARPDVVVRVFPDCGHFVHAEAGPSTPRPFFG